MPVGMIGKRNHMDSFRKVSKQEVNMAPHVAGLRKCSEKVFRG